MSVAVITGAAAGIGAGLAREAARRGMQVVLADRDATRLADVPRVIGSAALAVPTDVADPASLEALAERACAVHGIDGRQPASHREMLGGPAVVNPAIVG
jgi:NADP-dependent 3-hydroxy acid dehydrogenase YdfG